ncbi:MAG: hypothetical protein M1611_00085 [Candidatus Marsarchaeota archaeon]|jgi:hypothetical protein|nr:hypothetical protein [Candidatus Marsarchaeota archaeon]
MPKKEKEPRATANVFFVKLSSIADLARYVYNFDFTSENIYSFKSSGGYRLFAFGERVGEWRLAYFVEGVINPDGVRYIPPSTDESEKTELLTGGERHDATSINVIGIDLDGFISKQKHKWSNVKLVRLFTLNDIIKAVIKRRGSSDSLHFLYAFKSGSKTVLCCFELIDELEGEDTKAFYYTVLDSGAKTGKLARYNYIDNKVDFTDYAGEHSYLYVKIIYLAEPFPFFMMRE